MGRKTKKDFKIGDSFLSWVVIELQDAKKYKYLCRCSECGEERSFNKYNLLRGSYAPCRKCAHLKIKNISLIKKHWNCELNRAIFTKPQDFSLTHSYWFICDKGHNFKSSIKDFSLDRCLSCKNQLKNSTSRTQITEFALEYFNSVFDNVFLHEELSMITIEHDDIMIDIVFNEVDRFTSYRNYYNNEEELINDLTSLKKLEMTSKEQGYQFHLFEVESNFKINVDKLKDLMIQLVQRLQKQ